LDRDSPVRSGLPGGPKEKDLQGFKEKWANPKTRLEPVVLKIRFFSKTGHLSILS